MHVNTDNLLSTSKIQIQKNFYNDFFATEYMSKSIFL